jgi:hypothetical protein
MAALCLQVTDSGYIRVGSYAWLIISGSGKTLKTQAGQKRNENGDSLLQVTDSGYTLGVGSFVWLIISG